MMARTSTVTITLQVDTSGQPKGKKNIFFADDFEVQAISGPRNLGLCEYASKAL